MLTNNQQWWQIFIALFFFFFFYSLINKCIIVNKKICLCEWFSAATLQFIYIQHMHVWGVWKQAQKKMCWAEKRLWCFLVFYETDRQALRWSLQPLLSWLCRACVGWSSGLGRMPFLIYAQSHVVVKKKNNLLGMHLQRHACLHPALFRNFLLYFLISGFLTCRDDWQVLSDKFGSRKLWKRT